MQAILCDKCGEIIDGEQTTDFHRKTDDYSIEIGLNGDKDRCADCSRKLFAKAASTAWNELKQKRKPKEEDNKNGN